MDMFKWVCSFENKDGIQGCGIIVQFTGVETPQDLTESLPALKRMETPPETLWAIFTCHCVIPGDSFDGWKIKMSVGRKIVSHDLESMVCDAVSCCAAKSVISRGADTAGTKNHDGRPCLFDLDFTVLFCKQQMVDLCSKGVNPPYISIPISSNDLTSMITSTQQSAASNTYICGHEHEKLFLDEIKPNTLLHIEDNPRLADEIKKYQHLKLMHYNCPTVQKSSLDSKLLMPGAPIVFTNPKTKQDIIIGFHVHTEEEPDLDPEPWDQSSGGTRFYGNTIFGIVQLLQGGPVAVFAVLENPQVRRLWPNRWNHLLLPYLYCDDGSENKIELVRLLDILHMLCAKSDLKDRLLSLRTDIPIDARLASLELVSAVFAHFKEFDEHVITAVLSDESLGSRFGEDVRSDLRHIFRGIETTLGGMRGRFTEVHHADTVLVYFKCYNMVMNFKHVFIHEHMREGEYQALKLLTKVAQKFKTIDPVQECWREIVEKCWAFEKSFAGFLINIILKEREETVTSLKKEVKNLQEDISKLTESNENLKKLLKAETPKQKQFHVKGRQKAQVCDSEVVKADRPRSCSTGTSLLWKREGRKQWQSSDFSSSLDDLQVNIQSLTLIKWKDEHGEDKRLRVIRSISTKWREAGILLGIQDRELEAILSSNNQKAEDCCRTVLNKWIENGSAKYSTDWDGVHELLEDLDLSQVAVTLKNALDAINAPTLYYS